MGALTDALRADAADIVAKAAAIDAQPSVGLVWPAKRDLLAGTPIDQARVGLDTPFPYFETKMGEDARMKDWALASPGGMHFILHDSSGNFVVPPLVSPFALKIGCYGAGIRHLCHYLLDPSINAMLRGSASVGIIRGFVANEIGQEMASRTEAQMLGNIAYILDPLSRWLTGKWLWTMETPMPASYSADPNTTNARIGMVNKLIKQYMAGNPAVVCIDINAQLAPGWTDDTPQPLNTAYLVAGDGEGHLNAAGEAIWAAALRPYLQ